MPRRCRYAMLPMLIDAAPMATAAFTPPI